MDYFISGGTDTLVNEINAQITAKKAWKLILPGGPQLGAEAVKTGIDVEVTANFSKVSIITMLAPSPDWFIGIDSLDLCDNGKWRESMNITMLPPWDAGTEDGTAFSTGNAATNPHVNIFQITNSMPGAFNGPNPIPSLGEFRFMGLYLPVSQDNSIINSNSTINSTSASPSNEKSTAMSTMSTTTVTTTAATTATTTATTTTTTTTTQQQQQQQQQQQTATTTVTTTTTTTATATTTNNG